MIKIKLRLKATEKIPKDSEVRVVWRDFSNYPNKLMRKLDCGDFEVELGLLSPRTLEYKYIYFDGKKNYSETFMNGAYGFREERVFDNILIENSWDVEGTPSKRKPCALLWKSPIVSWNGDVTVCCNDHGFILKLGNLKDNTLKELWEGEIALKYRLNHILGKFNEMPILKTEKCPICLVCWDNLELSNGEVKDYLKQINRLDLMGSYINRVNGTSKVLLVNPRVSPMAFSKKTVTLGLGHIAGYIRQEYEVKILNMEQDNLFIEDVLKIIKKGEYNIVGITGMTYQANSGLKLGKAIKDMDSSIKTVFGGPFFSNTIQETLKENFSDFVIMGEGEQPFLELLGELKKNNKDFKKISGLSWKEDNKIMINESPKPMDPEKIKLPARDLMPTHGLFKDPFFNNSLTAIVMASRGCVGKCIFCSSPSFWGHKVRLRSIDSIISEIKQIIDTYHVKNFNFDDDVFTLVPSFLKEFCKRVTPLNIKWRVVSKVNLVNEKMLKMMKAAGCVRLAFGIESGDPNIRKLIGKELNDFEIKQTFETCRKLEISAGALMIIGHPGETSESIKKSIKLIEELNPNGGHDFQIMQPHPGTVLRERFNTKEYGEILTNNWNDYYSDNITYLPSAFSKEEFFNWCTLVTGRPIRMTSDLSNNDIKVSIDPSIWKSAKFDVWPPYYWKGKDDGFSHFLGKNEGFVEYEFGVPIVKVKQIKVRTRIASHSKQQAKEKKNASDITVEINGIEIGTKRIYYYWSNCPIEEWVVKDKQVLKKIKLKDIGNTLTFRIKSVAECKTGISIYYRALEPGLEDFPITVELI